jgi:hypothetical protein
MIHTSFNQVIVKVNGVPDIEIHTDGTSIFAYSYTLQRNLNKQEILRMLRDIGFKY